MKNDPRWQPMDTSGGETVTLAPAYGSSTGRLVVSYYGRAQAAFLSPAELRELAARCLVLAHELEIAAAEAVHDGE